MEINITREYKEGAWDYYMVRVGRVSGIFHIHGSLILEQIEGVVGQAEEEGGNAFHLLGSVLDTLRRLI